MSDVTQEFWEAFGVAGKNPRPIVRLDDLQPQHAGDVVPDDELDENGVRLIEFKAYGDDLTTAFVHVLGTSEKGVRETWWRVQAYLEDNDLFGDWWGLDRR